MDESAAADLASRLRQVEAEELLRLVRELPDEQLRGAAARQALRNPFAGSEVIVALLRRPALRHVYELRRDIAFHPQTPEARALELLPTLFWRDLAALGTEMRVRPTLRRAADRHLIRRFTGLSLGEKIALAKRAGPVLMSHARSDPSPAVIAALLDNPRLTEGLLAPLLQREDVNPAVLEVIARSRRWGQRYGIRRALCSNRRTPLATALALLPLLKKADQRALARDRRAAPPVRRRAKLLAGG
ncbi:MAG: hypothetical protein AAF604_04970 [Acidobacteriota bacterium]